MSKDKPYIEHSILGKCILNEDYPPRLLIVHPRDDEGDMISGLGDGSKGKFATLHHQNLAGERKTNTRAVALGGIEGNEEVSVMIRGDRGTIIADVETAVKPSGRDVLGVSLGGILHYVYYCLTKEVGVDGYCKRFGDVDMPLYGGIHTSEA